MIPTKSVPRGDFHYYDTVNTLGSLSQEKKVERRPEISTSALRPHEREIADRKIEAFEHLVRTFTDHKDNPETSEHFTIVSTSDGELNILKPKAMDTLSDKMSNIINLGRFSTLSVDFVVEVQSLLQPTIKSTTKNNLFAQEDEHIEWAESIVAAKLALKACKMVLDTMIAGRDDYRMRRDEVIDMVVDLIKFIKDACIIPIIQARKSDSSAELFTAASGQKKELQAVLHLCGSVVGHFATLIGKCNLSDRALNTMEFIALELVMEQNSDSEKDSVFGIQKFEQFRQKAVDVLAQIFAGHAEQRRSTLNGILSNLEKLPDKKASARHFKSAREVPIMTISALFMRFVQVAATNKEVQKQNNSFDPNDQVSESEGDDYELSTAKLQSKKSSTNPGKIAQDFSTNAQSIADNIAGSLVDRASNVSKTGDKPFRNLLDLFIEDFCNVLGSPEWPSADILLHRLMIRMLKIVNGKEATKQSVVDKDMALATLARVGCGVIDFKHRLKKLKRKELDITQSDISSKLDRLLDDAMSDDIKERINDMDFLAFDGPYRMVIESLGDYLGSHASQEDPHLQSIIGCYVTSWLAAIVRAFPDDAAANSLPQAAKEVREKLESMIMDPKWLSRKLYVLVTYRTIRNANKSSASKYHAVSDVQTRIAAGVITLQNQVSRSGPTIVTTLLRYARDKNSSKLRSRGMTGLEQLVHKDPSVIREDHVRNMVSWLSDTSPMARESALSLISTCLEREPSLEQHCLPSILQLTTDPSNGPKKRAIKLLRDIYAGPTSSNTKLKIASQLLLPSQDDEKAISELSRNVLEDIWFLPTKTSAKPDENQLKLDRVRRSLLIIESIQFIQGRPVEMEAFEKFFVHALSPDAKGPASNLRICKELVADLIDHVISPDTGSDVQSQARIMTALSVLAKVMPTLFTVDQIQLLKLYIKDLATFDDLAVLRPTVIIFRYVVATLQSLQQSFAEEIRANLMRNVSKLALWASQGVFASRDTLTDVAHCIWTVTPMADQGPEKLCTMITSIVCQLQPLASCTKEEAQEKRNKINSYLVLLGTFGKVCNFDQYIEIFREKMMTQSRNLVAKRLASEQQMKPLLSTTSSASLLLIDTVRPFTTQVWDMHIREQALQSVGGICQQSPTLFTRSEIKEVFQLVFLDNDDDPLKMAVLDAFSDYFSFAERRSETGAEIAVGEGAVTGYARLDTSFAANENDSATVTIARNFLPNFVHTALKNNDTLALLATNIIASVSRQGLVHPRECGAALIALSTSSNQQIAQSASTEAKRIHEKQESYLENEYLNAIHQAFKYQRDVLDDPHGMRLATYSPKLASFFEALKAGKLVTFRKFVNNFCKRVDFDLAKLDISGIIPEPVLFARFCLENLALLDFARLEELALCLNALESIVLKGTGPTVALAIEAEMPKQAITTELQGVLQAQLGDTAGVGTPHTPFANTAPTGSQPSQPTVDSDRLRQITTACMILLMVWETRIFIRRCYSLTKRKGVAQNTYAKPAQRNNFVSGKELWDGLMPIMNALDSPENMIKTCYDFAKLLEVDLEAVVGDDDDEDDGLGAGYETPNEGDDANGVQMPTSGRGRKRKSNFSANNTPKKPRGRPAGGKSKKRNSRTPDSDDDLD